MDAEFYEDMAATALELLEEFGRPVTLRSFSPGGGGKYNPATGRAVSNGQATQKDTTRNAVVVDAPANRIGPQYGQKLDTGTLVQDDNKWLYMDANGEAPTSRHKVVFDNKQWNVFNVQAYSPAGIPLMYLVVLRA